MNVAGPVRSGTRVALPANAGRPIEVYVNGVRQQEGADYRIAGDTLVFARVLEQEGRLGFWRWTSMLAGVAGTYRRNDVVDVIYARDGRRAMASGLPVEPDAA